jgi:hypothetical protein
MSNELMKQNGDGFEGYESGTEGGDQRQAGSVIQGVLLKFSNEAQWTVVGQRMPEGIELIAVGIARIVQKWLKELPEETRVLGPGEKFPDLEELNNAAPRSEWTEDLNGKPRGPWQRQHIVYLLDPATMDRYSFPTGTVGGAICVRELVDKTKWMRRYRGRDVCPVVTLSAVFMNTRFGGRQRPHLVIKRWIELGGDGEKALPAPTEQPATAPCDTKKPAEPMRSDALKARVAAIRSNPGEDGARLRRRGGATVAEESPEMGAAADDDRFAAAKERLEKLRVRRGGAVTERD